MSVEGEKRTAAESRGPGSAMHRNLPLQLHLLTADKPGYDRRRNRKEDVGREKGKI